MREKSIWQLLAWGLFVIPGVYWLLVWADYILPLRVATEEIKRVEVSRARFGGFGRYYGQLTQAYVTVCTDYSKLYYEPGSENVADFSDTVVMHKTQLLGRVIFMLYHNKSTAQVVKVPESRSFYHSIYFPLAATLLSVIALAGFELAIEIGPIAWIFTTVSWLFYGFN